MRRSFRVWLLLAVALLVGRAAAQQTAGVFVDPQGVLRKRTFDDPSGQLTRERLDAAKAALDPKVATRSPLRKISLNRLEQALEARRALGRGPSDEMRYLAGLTRIEYVFFYPDSGDIVVAGPAEGWMSDLSGRVVSMSTGKPVLELQDLAVALRAYPPQGVDDAADDADASETKVIGCSIDPTPEGLERMQDFLRQVGGFATPNHTQTIVEGLRSSLGLQKITVLGVPANSHFAQVMVEADYRMKLIGIGLERPPIALASYVDRANPANVSRNAMQRWYFVPDYDCVRVSSDSLAMHLVGQGVELVGENEVVLADGRRKQAAAEDRASAAFCHGFTKKYAQIAERSPVFAQLRNLIDLAIVAAFIRAQDYYGQANWTASVLRDDEALPVATYETPREVETAVNSLWKGNQLMTPVGGGVHVEAELALEPDNMQLDESGGLEKARDAVKLDLAEGQWWWD